MRPSEQKLRLKTRIIFTGSVDVRSHARLKMLSRQSRIPMSKLLDEAIEDLLIKHKFQEPLLLESMK